MPVSFLRRYLPLLLLLLLLALLPSCLGSSSPVWFEEHPQFSVALPGDSVFFSCKTNRQEADEAAPILRWLHNQSVVLADHHHEADEQDGGEGAAVLFRIPRPGLLNVRVDSRPERYAQQLGQYQCIAGTGERGQYVASLPARLTIAYLGDFLPERPRTVEAFRSNDVVLGCNAPDSNPPAFIQFYKDGRVLPEEEEGLNWRVLNGETLLIYNVSDANAGNYTCSASNHITDEKKMSLTWSQLKVKDPSRNEKSRLTFRPEERYSVLLGENLTIPCVASGHPKPDVIWTRMGNNERLNSSHGCLTITNAQEIDFGSYMCAIFNGSRRFLRRTTIHILVPPVFTRLPLAPPEPLDEGAPLWLHCQAMGTPVPAVAWTVNGLPLSEDDPGRTLADNGTLHIASLRRRDAGVYQCFVSNSVGQNFTTALVRVNPLPEFDDDAAWSPPSLLDHLALTPPSRPNVTQASRRSALVTWRVPGQRSSLSAMPIQFFKVQFREFRRGQHRSEWRTLDEVISARSRSFEVMGLKADVKYRFRVVAVYANDDNLHGPLSKRFRLDKSFNLDRPPRHAPAITQVLPLGQTSLRIGWKMSKLSLSSVEGYFIYIRKAVPRKKGEPRTRFRKVTLIGHESHSYIFEDLDPGTTYELRVEAFNLAGHSPSSRLSKMATLPLEKQEEEEAGKEAEEDPSSPPSSLPNVSDQAKADNSSAEETAVKDDLVPADDLVFFLVLGGALAGIVLMLVVCCSVVSCVQKSRARKRFSNANVAIREKYTDTSRQISLNHSYSRPHSTLSNTHQLYHGHQHQNGTVRATPNHNGSASTSAVTFNSENNNLDSSEVAIMSASQETSFTSPHRLSQMLGSIGDRRSLRHLSPHEEDDLFVSSSKTLEMDGGGGGGGVGGVSLSQSASSEAASASEHHQRAFQQPPRRSSPEDDDEEEAFEEYTDEPSILSWKRRRRSEEFL